MQTIKSVKYSVIKRDQFKYLRHIHDDWTLYIVISGSFMCTLSGKTEVMSAGDFYFIPPDTNFERSVLNKLLVHFIRFRLNDESPYPFPMPCGKVKYNDPIRLEGTLQMMRNTSKLPLEQRERYLCHYLNDILLQYGYERERFTKEPDNVKDELAADIMAYLKGHYKQKVNMKNVAALFGISPSGMIKKMQKAIGVLPQRYLINLRIKHAKRLLVDTSIPISEISEQSGFENAYYFSKAFKKETGVTPSEYRKTYLI